MFAFIFDKYLVLLQFSHGSACSHVGGLLFKLETCVGLQLNKKSVLSSFYLWNQ